MEQFKLYFIKKMGLTNHYVNNLGKLILKHNFEGVGPVDCFFMLNKKIPKSDKNLSFIINLSDCNEKGSHFVAIYVSSNKIYYFDSYGLPPFSPEIKKFIKKNKINGRTFKYNSQLIQNKDSIFCGYYCIAFLMSFDLNMTRTSFNKIFKNENKNDTTVINFIIKCI